MVDIQEVIKRMIRILLLSFLAVRIPALPTDLTTRQDDELDAEWNYRPESKLLGTPLELTVTSIRDDSAFARVQVSWRPPRGFDDVIGQKSIQEYILYYRETTSPKWTKLMIRGDSTSIYITGLLRKTLYHIQIRANTNSAEGPLSDVVFYETEGFEETSGGGVDDEETEDALDNEFGDDEENNEIPTPPTHHEYEDEFHGIW